MADDSDGKSAASGAGSDELQHAVTGNLGDLINYHRTKMNEGSVEPWLPFVLFRVGPILTSSENRYFALLNRDVMTKNQEMIDSYRAGESVEVVDPKILGMTLRDMLVQYVRDMDASSVPDSHRVAFETVRDTLFENNTSEPRNARPNKTEVIEYNLQPNPSKASQIDLNTIAGQCLSYIPLQQNATELIYGAIIVNLCYSTHSQGGRSPDFSTDNFGKSSR